MKAGMEPIPYVPWPSDARGLITPPPDQHTFRYIPPRWRYAFNANVISEYGRVPPQLRPHRDWLLHHPEWAQPRKARHARIGMTRPQQALRCPNLGLDLGLRLELLLAPALEDVAA